MFANTLRAMGARKRITASIFAITFSTISFTQTAYAGNATGCFAKGIYLAGKVQVVNNFPDLKVQLVKNFPDIKVQQVKNFPNKCGQWQFVENFPDFKIQIVKNFPDIKVQFVNNFPGVSR
jgi:hypothetical protein